MEVKNGKFGQFKACTGPPDCHNTKPILHTIGVLCPKLECQGELVERQARGRGRSFFYCANYPYCDFILNLRPLATPCIKCGRLMAPKNHNDAAYTSCSWQVPQKNIDYQGSPVCPQCGVFTQQSGAIYKCATCGYLTGGG
jgi:DNA topoisomerase-1